MPIYEYRCNACRKRFSVLVGVIAEDDPLQCPRCGSTEATRLISRFARLRNEDDLVDDMLDPDKIGDPEDPKTMRRWVKEMGKELGEDFTDEFDEILAEEEKRTAGAGVEEGDEEGGSEDLL
ncbi:MAG: zinc ribbon domain-containing protein [Armatimonadota bacterium]|nr:zinc ribbon domain-containing protein [bacterium]MDW8322055.1 zinc ribbon domain-containing protein [Armatimonadota bacterium]